MTPVSPWLLVICPLPRSRRSKRDKSTGDGTTKILFELFIHYLLSALVLYKNKQHDDDEVCNNLLHIFFTTFHFHFHSEDACRCFLSPSLELRAAFACACSLSEYCHTNAVDTPTNRKAATVLARQRLGSAHQPPIGVHTFGDLKRGPPPMLSFLNQQVC